MIGLNLRMTEVIAAIAVEQLNKIDQIVHERVKQAEAIKEVLKDVPWLQAQTVRENCTHVYYTVPWTIRAEVLGIDRSLLIKALHAEGFPLSAGYVAPLYRLPAFAAYTRPCPRAEWLHDFGLVYFENCSWTADNEQIEQFGEACRKINDDMDRLRRAA